MPIWRVVGKSTKAGEGVRKKTLTEQEMKLTREELTLVSDARNLGCKVDIDDESTTDEDEPEAEEESLLDEDEDEDEDEGEDEGENEEDSSMDED